MFEFKDMISIVSLFFSGLALYWSKKNWNESNRPIIAVSLVADGGNVATILNIVVFNTGNRPAFDVVLSAKKEDIDQILDLSHTSIFHDTVYKIFSGENVIPLILDGENVQNGFGIASHNEDNTFIWKSTLPIKIVYKDIKGKSYSNTQTLQIKNTSSFAGLEIV